jgi:DNA-binding transcriptional LysR family regulator
MNLNLLPDLALFVQIVDQGSFSAVARISGATPSAISRSVSRLEQQMGCKLHRSTRKLRLSDAGKTVYAHAQEMLESARQAMDPPAVRRKRRATDAQRAEGRRAVCDSSVNDGFLTRYPAWTSVCGLRTAIWI